MIEKSLLDLLGKEKRGLAVTVAWMVFGLLCNLAITAGICCMIGIMVQILAHGGQPFAFIPFFLLALAGILLRYLASCKVGDQKDALGRTVKKRLREQVYSKILRLGVHAAEEVGMAGLTQMALEGIEQLDLYYSSYIPQFFYAMVAPVILFLITVWIDWRVALVLLCCVPLIPLSIIAVSRYAKRIFSKYWGKYTSMGDGFLDSVQGLRELKIFQADAAQQEKMNQNAEEFRRITMKVLVMQLASTTIMDLVAYGGAGVGIAFVISGMVNRSLSPIAALFLTLVAVEFFLPLRAFGAAFHIAMNGASAGKKILSLLEQPDPIWGALEPSPHASIRMDHVSFSYDGKREVLRDLSIDFPPVGMTAVVGESGCGKSTVVGLALGTIRPNRGTVTLGGVPLSSLSREKYYAKIAAVSCNSYLFHMTVRENFLLARETMTEQEILDALQKVNLRDFILENGGLDKPLSEEAANLSGGQKQRLVLAINLAADREIYLFDEATSNIDIESEEIIMKNIRALSRKKMVIVISHRLENVIGADRIYYLEAGTLREQGTHASLMPLGGGYATLYTTQKRLEMGYAEVNNQ